MSQFTLAIDKREREILAILGAVASTDNKYCDGNGRVITWRAEHLTIGDYIIFYGDVALVVIERKTWTDLAASFRDGRKENIRKLRQYREHTSAQIAYLIEGAAFPAAGTRFARIPYRNLRAHLDHLIMRDGIIELRAQTAQHTVERLFEFIRNLSTMRADELLGGAGNGRESTQIDSKCANDCKSDTESRDHLALAKVSFRESDAIIVDRLWCCIPNISTAVVKLFREYHIADLLLGKLSEAKLAELQYPNGRKLGTKKAKKIAAVAKLTAHSNAPVYLRILATIPSISRTTASKILEAYSMSAILTEWDTIRPQLVNLSRGKMRLGENAVAAIERFLIKKEIVVPETVSNDMVAYVVITSPTQ